MKNDYAYNKITEPFIKDAFEGKTIKEMRHNAEENVDEIVFSDLSILVIWVDVGGGLFYDYNKEL